MRYHIDTIPVWDALKLDGECLLCSLERKTELGEAERYLGASVMEPDTRVQVNTKGFCRHHHAMLFSMSNRLGHALMLESHMMETRERTEKIYKKLENAAETLKGIGLAGKLGGKTKGADLAVKESIEALNGITDSCLMCETIEENMQRYLHPVSERQRFPQQVCRKQRTLPAAYGPPAGGGTGGTVPESVGRTDQRADQTATGEHGPDAGRYLMVHQEI